MDLARYWLGKCIREHPRCGGGIGSQLPTRVLNLGPSSFASNRIRLYEPRGQCGRYICLTYCWGKSEFIKTTRKTLESHKKNIHFNTLPQTFRDTVRIARALDIQYVWIDSLCIIQDDEADWRRESIRMADVYRHSYLTVAPSWADSPNAGCFTTAGKGVEIGPVTVSPIHHFPNLKEFQHFPLLSRAWTYQERMLSPRILYFGKHEMLWECVKRRTCECGDARYGPYDVSKANFHDMVSKSHNRRAHQQLWRQMVVQYTPLQLTYRTDRLPAFGGLASEMQRCSKQQYLAGLWKECLIPDMCWSKSLVGVSEIDSAGIFQQTPTWSWASIDGPVSYPYNLFNPHSDGSPFWDIVEDPEVLDVSFPLLNSSTLGEAQNGFVELSCCLIPAKIVERQVYVDGVAFQYTLDRGRKEDMKDGGDYCLVPMLTTPVFCGLILQQRGDDPEEMIRIGVLFLSRHTLKYADPGHLEKLKSRPHNGKVRIF